MEKISKMYKYKIAQIEMKYFKIKTIWFIVNPSILYKNNNKIKNKCGLFKTLVCVKNHVFPIIL